MELKSLLIIHLLDTDVACLPAYAWAPTSSTTSNFLQQDYRLLRRPFISAGIRTSGIILLKWSYSWEFEQVNLVSPIVFMLKTFIVTNDKQTDEDYTRAYIF